MAIKPYIKDSSKYCADTRCNGKRLRKLFPRTKEGRRQAELWILAQKNAVPKVEVGNRSFVEAFEYYTNRTAFVDNSKQTQRKYKFRLNEFIEFASCRGKLYLSEFTTVDAEAYGTFVITKYEGKGKTERLRLASGIFKHEIDRDDATITRNPFRSVKKSYESTKGIQFIEEEMLASMLQFTKPRDLAILTILYTTGMRTRELELLRKQDVLPNGTMLRRYVGRSLKTKASESFIPHGDATWKAYQWLFANNPQGDYVLKGDSPAGKVYIWDRFDRLRTRLKALIPNMPHCTPHSLRRSLSTHLAEKGVPIPAIKHMLRHTSEKITLKYYVGTSTKMINSAVEKIESGHLVSTFERLNSQQPIAS